MLVADDPALLQEDHGLGDPGGMVPCSLEVTSDVDQTQPFRDSIRLPPNRLLQAALKLVLIIVKSMTSARSRPATTGRRTSRVH